MFYPKQIRIPRLFASPSLDCDSMSTALKWWNTFLVNFPRWLFNFTAIALSICLKQPKNAMKLLLSFYFNLYLLLHAWWTQAQMCLAKDIYSIAVKLHSRCGKASRNFPILLYKNIFIDVWNFPVQILSLHCQWWVLLKQFTRLQQMIWQRNLNTIHRLIANKIVSALGNHWFKWIRLKFSVNVCQCLLELNGSLVFNWTTKEDMETLLK